MIPREKMQKNTPTSGLAQKSLALAFQKHTQAIACEFECNLERHVALDGSSCTTFVHFIVSPDGSTGKGNLQQLHGINPVELSFNCNISYHRNRNTTCPNWWRSGRTPLHIAAQLGHGLVVQQLLAARAAISAADTYGHGPTGSCRFFHCLSHKEKQR